MAFTPSELTNLLNEALGFYAEKMRVRQEQHDEEGCGAVFAFEALYEDDDGYNYEDDE